MDVPYIGVIWVHWCNIFLFTCNFNLQRRREGDHEIVSIEVFGI